METNQLRDDSARGFKHNGCASRMAIPEMKTFVLLAAAATLGGCEVYTGPDSPTGKPVFTTAFTDSAERAYLDRK